jgi:hypothetical protein
MSIANPDRPWKVYALLSVKISDFDIYIRERDRFGQKPLTA